VGHSIAVGDYLKAIYKLQEGDEPVTTLHLANRLGVSAASATGMVKKLAAQALVEHTPYHGVRLTAQGEADALELIRHHRLVELFLTQQVGMPWEKVDAEAERLEHVLSEDLEARMDEILGFPTCDPHGDPIPSPVGTVAIQHLERLSELSSGDRAIVRRVSDSDAQALHRLGEAKLFPGAHVRVVECAAEAPVRLLVGVEEIVLEGQDAARVFVERLER
jgi:DtxR family Mn-dependent transcriptional regulator